MASPEEAPKIPLMQRIFLQLDELNVRTQRLLEAQQNMVPEGVEEAETITVNPPGIVLDSGAPPSFQTRMKGPWVSISVTNDGPSDITLVVNGHEAYSDTLHETETRTIDMKAKGKITRIEIYAVAAATVRIAAIR